MSGRWLSSYGGRPHRGLAKFLSRILSRRDDWKLTSRHDVDDLVIVDGKVVSTFTDTHTARMIGYLNITGLKLALLLNFKNAGLTWKRVVNERVHEKAIPPDLHSSHP